MALMAMIVFVDAGAVLGRQRLDKETPTSRGIAFVNESGRKCDVFWVNTFKKPEEFVPQYVEDGVSIGLAYGADKPISSYIGHTFEIRELPSTKGLAKGRCAFSKCRKVRYTVTDRQDQKVTINPDFTVTIRDQKERIFSKTDDMVKKCQEKADKEGYSLLESIEFVAECLEQEMKEKVDFDKHERSFHSMVHRQMAAELVPFTCANVNETQSLEIFNATWEDRDDENYEKEYKIRQLHQLPTSEIFVVEDFVSKEACDAIKVYRQNSKESEAVGIPIQAATEKTKQGELLLGVYYRMYQLIVDQFEDWKELNFKGQFLFEHIKDPVGFKTPSHLCVTQEDVDEVVAAMEAGKPKKCLIPGGVPESATTKHVVVEEGMSNDEKSQKRQLAQMFLFCDEPKDQLGGLHFPYASVHATPKVGKLVVAVHRHEGDENHGFDGYVNEYHLCPNHDVYVHTVYDHDPPEYVPPPGDDEGEL